MTSLDKLVIPFVTGQWAQLER